MVQVISKEQSLELFSEYPEEHTTIQQNLMLDFDLTIEGKPIPGAEDDLTVSQVYACVHEFHQYHDECNLAQARL